MINLPCCRAVNSDAERRSRIVSSAACVFSEKGYHAATMDEVSRRAGMSKKTVYQLFSSKAEIFDVLLQNWALPFNTPFDVDGRSQREVLSDALFRLATFALADAQIAISRVLIAEAARPGDVADALAGLGIGRGHWALEHWLASQAMLGQHRIDDPVELAAMIFHAVIGDALFNLLLRIRARPDEAAIRSRIDRVVGLYFDA